ncbi:MAG: hypothetical protein IJ716_10235 [Lachnospiraceae bacterium]|nr:hypothetical protein [Lachnospiraceae bacterium]
MMYQEITRKIGDKKAQEEIRRLFDEEKPEEMWRTIKQVKYHQEKQGESCQQTLDTNKKCPILQSSGENVKIMLYISV